MALACILITDTRDASYREAWDDGRGVSSAKFGDLHGSKSPRKFHMLYGWIGFRVWGNVVTAVIGHCHRRSFITMLGGSWVLVSGVVSPLVWVITIQLPYLYSHS